MGGRLSVRVAADGDDRAEAERQVARVGRRIDAWASKLTRFAESSDLSRLNRDEGTCTAVRPTLAAVLAWAWTAGERSRRVVDVTLLDARLAAERDHGAGGAGSGLDPAVVSVSWKVDHSGRSSVVRRPPGTRFDLDGVAKGWIADRALALLCRWPGALVDADGDIAMAVAPGTDWHVAVEDPRLPGGPPLALLHVVSPGPWHQRLGIATSGTTVHRWPTADGTAAHHLIDPRTASPAATDVVQATVVAPSASEAEVLAKSAVILGSADGSRLLERSACLFGLLVLESGETIVLPDAGGSQA